MPVNNSLLAEHPIPQVVLDRMAELTLDQCLHLVYRLLLNRPPDDSGWSTFSSLLKGENRPDLLISWIVDSFEFHALHGAERLKNFYSFVERAGSLDLMALVELDEVAAHVDPAIAAS
ncbi:MAG: hypothetical protein IRZ15_05905 [Bryobacteraceae bacterium]|nr:hypothetical protein [Bryobacteraceae bacterium]